jgi:hypothetical protein
VRSTPFLLEPKLNMSTAVRSTRSRSHRARYPSCSCADWVIPQDPLAVTRPPSRLCASRIRAASANAPLALRVQSSQHLRGLTTDGGGGQAIKITAGVGRLDRFTSGPLHISTGGHPKGGQRALASVPVSEADRVTSVRQAAALCNVTPPVVRRWLSLGLIPEPPWTRQQLHQVRDDTIPRVAAAALRCHTAP